jgi:hypothetical protein
VKVKLILPALEEATDPHFRPIKYSLFPPLGLMTLAAYLDPGDEVEICAGEIEAGYERARSDFYRWGSILRGSAAREPPGESLRHAAYQVGWKKLGWVWDTAIRLKRLSDARPALERVLAPAAAPAALR